MAKRLKRQKKEESDEINRQVNQGIVTVPKVIGRFKYKQRKTDYLLEEDLSGNLRQMQPLSND